MFFQALLEAVWAESLVSFNVVEDFVSILELHRRVVTISVVIAGGGDSGSKIMEQGDQGLGFDEAR